MTTVRVLVVDDNADAREMLSCVLSLKGHETRTAHDGPSALAMVIDWRPDVVLLDIGLPGMDGHALARRLRERVDLQDTVLVALTGWGQDSDRRLSAEAGIDHHMTKPVDPEILERLLSNPLHRKSRGQETSS